MIVTDLYDQILVQPSKAGATQLLIVSGYATASMAHRHLAEQTIQQRGIKIQLICGMASVGGISLVDHAMFTQLEESSRFKCNYRVDRTPVHSKVYIWMHDSTPAKAFVGSANYTQRGFLGGHQREAMTEASPIDAYAYYREILRGSMEISHDEIDQHVTLYSPDEPLKAGLDDCVSLSLLTRDGVVGKRSGLNWGQRQGRHPNQAYLRVPSRISRREFFPSRATQFTVRTDDGFSFIAVVAQDNNKAIHTPDGNNILGEYFRRRLGVELGAPVTRDDLDTYGRTDVQFCKLDEETFLMDFSV